jgi:nicotinamidase/pyrazinamidase
MTHAKEIAMEGSALLIVDVQNDFCPGGSLAVPDGDAVVPVLNRYIALFQAKGRPILASRDWHPAQTTHFRAYGGIWPPHCVQQTEGAAFHPDLQLPPQAVILSKGMDPARDAYSVFQAVTAAGTPCHDYLQQTGINHLFVGGLATDYCVKASVLDARQLGLAVTLLTDGIRGVNLQPDDAERAMAEMTGAGAMLATLENIVI